MGALSVANVLLDLVIKTRLADCAKFWVACITKKIQKLYCITGTYIAMILIVCIKTLLEIGLKHVSQIFVENAEAHKFSTKHFPSAGRISDGEPL